MNELAELSRKYRRTRAEAEQARAKLYDAIVEADACDVQQRAIVEATGFTREYIRRLLLGRKAKSPAPATAASRSGSAEDGGIAPAPRGA